MKFFVKLAAVLAAVFVGLPCHATLIITVPTQEGMLIVSDKLRQNDDYGYADDTEKVVRLTSWAAVAVTGVGGFTEVHFAGTNVIRKERMFTFEIAKSYFITNRVEEFNGQHFADSMCQQLSNFLGNSTLEINPEDVACQFLVFRATPGREQRTFAAVLKVAKIGSNLTVSASSQTAIQRNNDPTQIGAYGNAELPLELTRGHDRQFAVLRADPLIARFLPSGPAIKKVKLADAQAFAKRLMAEATAKTKLLNPVIGTNLDEVVIRFK